MKKIRLLFMIPTLGQGGAEKVLINLVNNLDKTRFDITVLTLFDTGVNKQFLHSDVHYCSCMKRSFRGNIHFLKLFSPRILYKHFVASKGEFDILVSYLEGPTARIISGCVQDNKKLISWIHSVQGTVQNASISFRSVQEAASCYEKFDDIVCVAEKVKEDFCRIFRNVQNCEVLYNTLDSEDLLNKAKELAPDYETDGKMHLVAVGTLKEIKAFDRLLRIAKRLIDQNYSIHLYILGKGPLKNQFNQFIRENDLSNSVTLLGYQINPYKYIARSDVFLCSSYSEGFSTATTEALILGVPVCTVEVSGMKEMLGNNNEYGIVTENNEEALYKGIKCLLDNPNLLAHYKKMATIRGKDFQLKQTVNAVEEMLEGVLEKQ